MRTEYKVVPAPEKARKTRGLKGPALFARAVEDLMNELATEGWTYLRADTLPQEERSGLTNKTTTYRNLLVFQRIVIGDAADQPAPAASQAPEKTPDASPQATPETDDEVTNLWQSAPDEAPETRKTLVADRQGKRVDL